MGAKRDWVDEAMPAARRSETRLRAMCPAASELRGVADRFREGHFHGALLDAMRLLDAGPIPILCASPTYLARAALTPSARMLVTLVDGETKLEELLEQSGLGLVEGFEAVCTLLDAELVVFDEDDVADPITLPGA